MKLPFNVDSACPQPVKATLQNVRSLLERAVSWPMAEYPDVASLPNATVWDRREVIVTDIDGMGTWGRALARGGDWYDLNGSAL